MHAFTAAVADGRLEKALAAAQGELLPELEHDWVDDAREAHAREVAQVIEQLAADAESRGDLPAAIEYTHRLVALDPLAEGHARALIRRLAAVQDRAAALGAYDRHRERLRTDLGVARPLPAEEVWQRDQAEPIPLPEALETPPNRCSAASQSSSC